MDLNFCKSTINFFNSNIERFDVYININMERRSLSSAPHDQSEVRSLKTEIVNLKELIAKITDDSQKQIALLKAQIAQYESNAALQQPSSPSKNEKILMQELSNLKKAQSEENTKFSTETQKEISSLRYEIAELKNSIAKQEAKNAQLTVENLSLKTKIHNLQDELSDKQIEVLSHRSSFKEGASKLIQAQMNSHKEIINRLTETQKEFMNFKKRMLDLMSEVSHQHEIAERNEKSVDYLLRSLSIVSDLPHAEIPTAKFFIDNPDALISFVDNVESACRTQRNAMQNEVFEASKTLANTMIMAQRPPLSLPVARALTNLGEVILDVTKQMDEDHKQTMRLLNQNIDLSDDLLDDLIAT